MNRFKYILLSMLIVLGLFSCSEEKLPPLDNPYTLPFDLQYYSSQHEVDSILSSVEVLDKSGNEGDYTYNYTMDDKVAKLTLSCSYLRDSLYKIDFREQYIFDKVLSDLSLSKQKGIAKSILHSLNIDVSKMIEIKDAGSEEYIWLDGDNKITLYGGLPFILIFEGSKFTEELDRKRSEETSKRISERLENGVNAKVENSVWDGSVSQVEKYLKKTLKDPKSYEGIEWTEIRKENNSYIVRHKYRAKNSFGGYVINNQIFTINLKGEVTNVVDIN